MTGRREAAWAAYAITVMPEDPEPGVLASVGLAALRHAFDQGYALGRYCSGTADEQCDGWPTMVALLAVDGWPDAALLVCDEHGPWWAAAEVDNAEVRLLELRGGLERSGGGE